MSSIFSTDGLIPTISPFVGEAIAQTQTETKTITAPPPDIGQPLLIGTSFLGGAVILWGVAAKLIEKYGNSAIEAKQKEVDQKLEEQKQDLQEQKQLSQFLLEQAKRDSGTINDTLKETSKKLFDISEIFVSKHLDSSKQYLDLYYQLDERIKTLEGRAQSANDRLLALETLLKDILAVLKMRERQNS
jgi:hypothetical protein